MVLKDISFLFFLQNYGRAGPAVSQFIFMYCSVYAIAQETGQFI